MRATGKRAGARTAAGTGRAASRGRADEVSLVRDLLREHLHAGGSKRGHRLPYEHVLTRELDCSRNVLREALALLVADGILRRERGRGTHVLTTSPAISIDQGFDLAYAMRAEISPRSADDAVTYQVLRIDWVLTPSLLAGLLGVAAGTQVSHVERLVKLEERRVGHWDMYITGVPAGAQLAELARMKQAEPLLRGVGLHPHQEEVQVEAITPSPRTAGLLYCGARDRPTLRVTRRFFDARDRLLAIAIGRCAWPAATFSVVRECAVDP